MRVAVIGTPRSGNSLLRKVLAQAYGLAEAASHDPAFLLGELADDTVYQVHARYSARTHRSLLAQQVVIVTPSRHPLDVLLSMLHFAQFEPDVSGWLGGDYLRELEGCDPTSRMFREFVLGAGSRDLLAVTTGWWAHAHVPITYAQMARRPLSVLASDGLGSRRVLVADPEIEAAASFARFHATSNMHGWMGRPGYWVDYIPASLAVEIRDAHAEAFGAYDTHGARDVSKTDVRVLWARRFSGAEPSSHTQLAATDA